MGSFERMTRALNKYVLFIKLRWAEIMRGRGADKVTRREFIQYARQVAAEYQYLKLTNQLDQALVGAVSLKTEPKPTHHNCTQTSYSICTAINSVPSRYDAANQTQRVEQQNKAINVNTKATIASSKKKETKQERSYLYTYQLSPDQSEESLPMTRHADDELSDSSSEENNTKQHMDEQYFKFMAHATQMAFESMNEVYLSKSKIMTQTKNKLQPVEHINTSHLYNTKGTSPFTSFDSLQPVRDTTINSGDDWSETKDDTSKHNPVKRHVSTKANMTGPSLAGYAATTAAAATVRSMAGTAAVTQTTEANLLSNQAVTANQMSKSDKPARELKLHGATNYPYYTNNPSPFTSFDSLPRSESIISTDEKASMKVSRKSSRQATTTTATAVAATFASVAASTGIVKSTPTTTAVYNATQSIANQAKRAEQIQKQPIDKSNIEPVDNSTKPALPETEHRKMTITSDAIFSDGVDGLNEHTNIVQISSHVMRSMMSEAKSDGLMSGGDYLLDENDTQVIDKLIDESSQLSNDKILNSFDNDEEERLSVAQYGNESMTETISAIVESVSVITQNVLDKRVSTLISVSDISNNVNNDVEETLKKIKVPESEVTNSIDNDNISLGDIVLSEIDYVETEELSEDGETPVIRITRVADPPLADLLSDFGSDITDDNRRETLKVPSLQDNHTSQNDDEIIDMLDDDLMMTYDDDEVELSEDEFSIGSDVDDDISGSIDPDDMSEIATKMATLESTPEDTVLLENEPMKKKKSIFGKLRQSIRSVLRRESKEMKEKHGTFEERNGMLY